MVSALDSGLRGPGSSPGLLSQCLGNLTKYWGVTCDGLASHPGGVAILLVASCYGNRDKLRLCGPLGS